MLLILVSSEGEHASVRCIHKNYRKTLKYLIVLLEGEHNSRCPE
jgi:hypothetical protein